MVEGETWGTWRGETIELKKKLYQVEEFGGTKWKDIDKEVQREKVEYKGSVFGRN